MGEVMDWDAAYRNDVFAGPPPWNIGVAQPAIVTVIESGAVQGPVLDVGCGVGDVSFALAERGYQVVGVDVSQVAVTAAQQGARERGLTGVQFIAGDVRKLAFVEEFNTVVDCTLFHSLPVDARDDYLRGASAAVTAGGKLFMLVFTTDALPPDSPFPIPNLVTEQEVRDAVSKHWEVDQLQNASVVVRLPYAPDYVGPDFQVDDDGMVKLPALLLVAHKP